MTHQQYKDAHCNNQRTAAYRIKQVLGIGYDGNSELTEEQLTALLNRFQTEKAAGEQVQKTKAEQKVKNYNLSPVSVNVESNFVKEQTPPEAIANAMLWEEASFSLPVTVSEKQPKTKDQPQPQTEKETVTKTENVIMFFAPLFVNLVSIALTIAGLFLFASFFGVALGSMFGITLLCAVIVSRNKMKGDTSQAALNVVLWMELGACLLHPFTFYTALPECHNYLKIGASLVMAAFVAILSYNAVIMVRNYNAE